MTNVVVTFKIMPDSPDRDINELKQKVGDALSKFGKIYKDKVEPIAFGLNALIFSVVTPEKEGGTEPLENAVKEIEGISDVQVTDVTRFVDVDDL